MKKFMLIVAGSLFLALPSQLRAQEDDKNVTQEIKQGVKSGAKAVKKGVKKGAHEVAEQASEAKSDITRTEVEGKMGPNGEDIFLDKDSRYFYIDDKGHKVYVAGSALRNRPPKLEDD